MSLRKSIEIKCLIGLSVLCCKAGQYVKILPPALVSPITDADFDGWSDALMHRLICAFRIYTFCLDLLFLSVSVLIVFRLFISLFEMAWDRRGSCSLRYLRLCHTAVETKRLHSRVTHFCKLSYRRVCASEVLCVRSWSRIDAQTTPCQTNVLLLRRSEMKLLKRIFLITPVRHSQTHMLFQRWLFSLSSLWETTVRPATCFLPHKPEIQQPEQALLSHFSLWPCESGGLVTAPWIRRPDAVWYMTSLSDSSDDRHS